MYISRIWLDATKRPTMKALASPRLFHGAIERAFPTHGVRRLWRLDPLRGRWCLLIVSPDVPDLSEAVVQFGFPGLPDACQTRDYAPLLARIRAGGRWHFRLTANPTHSAKSPNEDPRGQRGTVYPHVTPEHQRQWLLDRAERHGFALAKDDFDVVHSQWHVFRKGGEGSPVRLLSATFEGLLSVVDADLFTAALTGGIGRAKAYGMGLLTVVR